MLKGKQSNSTAEGKQKSVGLVSTVYLPTVRAVPERVPTPDPYALFTFEGSVSLTEDQIENRNKILRASFTNRIAPISGIK